MKLKQLSIVLSLVGTLLLYLVSMFSETPFVTLQDIQKYEGRQVIVRGRVKDYHRTNYGNQIITIEDENLILIVFVAEETEVEYGDLIDAIGSVQRYKNDWEIVVDKKQNILIIEKWGNKSFPLWQLSENPERYLGMNVNVTGTIGDIYESYFYLVDQDKKQSIMVFYKGKYDISIIKEGKAYVAGRFCFDKDKFMYYLAIENEKHGVWEIKEEG